MQQEKKKSYIQGNVHETISRIASRDFVGQKRVVQYKVVGREKLPIKNMLPGRVKFTTEGESFPDRQKLKAFITKLSLREMSKRLLQAEKKGF